MACSSEGLRSLCISICLGRGRRRSRALPRPRRWRVSWGSGTGGGAKRRAQKGRIASVVGPGGSDPTSSESARDISHRLRFAVTYGMIYRICARSLQWTMMVFASAICDRQGTRPQASRIATREISVARRGLCRSPYHRSDCSDERSDRIACFRASPPIPFLSTLRPQGASADRYAYSGQAPQGFSASRCSISWSATSRFPYGVKWMSPVSKIFGWIRTRRDA